MELLEMANTSAVKNSPHKINSRLNASEQKIRELKDIDCQSHLN